MILLYIDNDPDFFPILVHFCENSGSIDIHQEKSGAAAREWLTSNHADVIVSENDLPDMSGIRLLELLRAGGNLTPFIFFTVNESPLNKEKAHRMGAYGYITRTGTGKKPILHLMRMLNWAAHDAQRQIR
ncbi:MAG: response regulator [Methanoregula sp.]|nr:response regulator [Methanoregula sp.]